MYAVKPNGACRVYSEGQPLEDDETLYDDLPQFALDLAQRILRGE
jgi:hypothetical protein